MHLCKKWLKYAFAYASMQMHNYPKPSYNEQNEFFWLVLRLYFLGCNKEKSGYNEQNQVLMNKICLKGVFNYLF